MRARGDPQQGVCKRGGDLVAKEMVRSAQSKEECVQCAPRSRGFIVKGEGTQKSGRQPEEDDLPRFLGVADVPELLRGESMTLIVT